MDIACKANTTQGCLASACWSLDSEAAAAQVEAAGWLEAGQACPGLRLQLVPPDADADDMG